MLKIIMVMFLILRMLIIVNIYNLGKTFHYHF